MKGVRVLEVAQYTYTPSAGAVLADWGAEVIKVEHAVMGDAQRGLKVGPTSVAVGKFHPIMEHPNRGKRSIGLALETPEGHAVLLELAKNADVFLTNFLVDARERLKIDVDDIRAANPNIIYVRGTALGVRGPEYDKGGFDGSVFWCRTGSAMGATPPDLEKLVNQPAGAYGDSMGGMTIAGGISAALFARERTGEPSVVDVSLLSVGAWATALSVNISLLTGEPMLAAPLSANSAMFNPVVATYKTSDGRFINFTMLQAGRYWADLCRHLDREDLITDPRFDTVEKLMGNAAEASAILTEVLASRTFAEWTEKFRTLEGQWAPVQNSLEVGHDPQLRANGYIAKVIDADGVERELVANPVQFDETPAEIKRAPQFAEHTDDILRDLGKTEDEIIELKIAGAVT
ncbi:MAG: CaiB/BaiF CoA transferase family protein [Acidimicrobiia bacterium]